MGALWLQPLNHKVHKEGAKATELFNYVLLPTTNRFTKLEIATYLGQLEQLEIRNFVAGFWIPVAGCWILVI